MLARSRRPLGDADRKLIAQYRQNARGTPRFDAKLTFLVGSAGLVLGYIWQRNAPALIAALAMAGAAVGFAVDCLRYRRDRHRFDRAAAATWDPVAAAETVETVRADASSSVRLDDDEGNTAWFLQTGDRQILCVWDWTDAPCERVELDLVPGSTLTTLRLEWSGTALSQLHPARRFRPGEREPEQAEEIEGTLDELERLLRGRGAE